MTQYISAYFHRAMFISHGGNFSTSFLVPFFQTHVMCTRLVNACHRDTLADGVLFVHKLPIYK